MKKIILGVFFALIAIGAFAQKNNVEVLYFKAQLACCRAAACNNLENEVKTIIEKNFPNGNVTFKQVALADETNKPLVEKHNAKSQTVVIVKTAKKKETSTDISDIIRSYARTNDKAKFETELIAKINETLK
ncbi:MAG: hypothetical protein PHU62_01685 [Bacteroidales bacterium]|nr:hypothetical protein [Bacteroidales bacterium]MDD2203815.1 hypothetical protein [Bacteroidales bacterium]MDD3913246.1 hypothetical protein [Bacteroidales bacterium]MDD4633277.1 hypothetical protein [Bacteroidales bacterium]